MSMQIVFEQILIIFGYVIVGYVAGKKNLKQKKQSRKNLLQKRNNISQKMRRTINIRRIFYVRIALHRRGIMSLKPAHRRNILCAGFFLIYAFGSLNELFRDTIRLNTGAPSLESWMSAQKNPVLTNWKLS